jgi:hypothetical protein
LRLSATTGVVSTLLSEFGTRQLVRIGNVSYRTSEVAENVRKIRRKSFAIEIHEAIDCPNDAHVITYVRYVDGADEIVFTRLQRD